MSYLKIMTYTSLLKWLPEDGIEVLKYVGGDMRHK